MALNANVLAALIESEIQSQVGSAPTDPTQLQKFALALATAIVDHITANAVVTVTGVQSGSNSATGGIS